MLSFSLRSAIVAAAMFSTVAAFAADAPKVGETAKGKTLVNASGMTLYTFDKDTAGKSVCNGTCATNWPPLDAGQGAKASGQYTVITRDDGTKQWAYKGKPLYTWAKDMKPGDITGDGVNNNTWHVATP